MSDQTAATPTQRRPVRRTPTRKTPLKERNEIVTCSNCDISLTKNDFSNHDLVCSTENPFTIGKAFSDFSFSNGFISSAGVLFGSIRVVKLPMEMQSLDQWTKDHMILMNVSSMAAFKVVLESAVSVTGHSQSGKNIAVVWPYDCLPSLVIGLPASRAYAALLKNERFVSVKPIMVSTASAVSVRVLSRVRCAEQPNFDSYLRCCLNNVVFASPSLETVQLYGQQLTVRLAVAGTSLTIDAMPSLLSELHISSGTGSADASYPSVSGEAEECSTSAAAPSCYFKIDRSTTVTIEKKDRRSVSFKDVGGVHGAKEALRHHVIYPLQLLRANEISAGQIYTRRILLYGLSGCGKTLLAKALSTEADLPFISLHQAGLSLRTRVSDLLARLSQAGRPAFSLVFLDEIDSAFADKRFHNGNLRSVRKLMDEAEEGDFPFIFVAATKVPEKLPCEIRRKFDLEIEVAAPMASERVDVLNTILNDFSHELKGADIAELAEKTHGYTPSDLKTLCKEAASVCCVRQYESKNSCRVSVDDLLFALNKVCPSAMREIFIDIPKVKWSEIGGMHELKLKLKQAVEWPLKHADRFKKLGITAPKGILMYGPPGCSKTMIAKALATESGVNFIAVRGPELFSKWVGESERAVRDVFRRARQVAPSIVFFDEIDAVACERSSSQESGRVGDRVLTQLLTEMDGIQALSMVTIVAATNRPDKIDPALLRPGRLDRLIYVPLPDKATRLEILRLRCAHMPIASDVSLEHLARNTSQYSGSELVAVCNEAALIAMREKLDACEIRQKHFDESLKLVRARTSKSLLEIYEAFNADSN